MSKQFIKNLFGTILTYPAPSANYRGESEENRTVLQKISKNGKDFAIFSSEAKRNALREILIKKNIATNRTRLHNEGQLAVEFKEFPNADKYADDFIFGYMVADSKYLPKDRKDATLKRDSILRINNSIALSPYQYEATFHQSPLNAKTKVNEDKYWSNQSTSVLLHKEISHTAFQYPFALAGNDCKAKPDWIKVLLESIGELTNVAGGHARNYYEMGPKSIVIRLTPSLVAGYDTYGFQENGSLEVLKRIKDKEGKIDLPGEEFYLGGEIVRNLSESKYTELKNFGVKLFENPQKLLKQVADDFLDESK
ncbi:type I-B CRISPR-associated protein Cas7/Cst2/DevR [Leptospira kmetyi]|uniref:Type I-B CRISPR-associated protein Cas7/Cst2/DevR n=1 Tax=Leptospira kmetyi TaxID=408139 RepID=A0AAD0XMX6_9LEPT|nr:type I-B CRISPR-associated protein Cas7/Cst2/DevR [Leptospira kmetyi]AYV54085.1 type I-B CRISPR-associated protein Cas7/Cst2/DevR [Leptospira kmetyi]